MKRVEDGYYGCTSSKAAWPTVLYPAGKGQNALSASAPTSERPGETRISRLTAVLSPSLVC
jgi:hypothetical protein